MLTELQGIGGAARITDGNLRFSANLHKAVVITSNLPVIGSTRAEASLFDWEAPDYLPVLQRRAEKLDEVLGVILPPGWDGVRAALVRCNASLSGERSRRGVQPRRQPQLQDIFRTSDDGTTHKR